jgi:hypothetical protein
VEYLQVMALGELLRHRARPVRTVVVDNDNLGLEPCGGDRLLDASDQLIQVVPLVVSRDDY